jgi:hypothetical protein
MVKPPAAGEIFAIQTNGVTDEASQHWNIVEPGKSALSGCFCFTNDKE